MIEEVVVVSAVEAGLVWVIPAVAGCGSCHKVSCGSLFASMARQGHPVFAVPVLTELPVMPGDRVRVGVSGHALLKGSFMVYGVPLLGLLVLSLLGMALADWLPSLPADATVALSGLAGLGLSLLWVRLSQRPGQSGIVLLGMADSPSYPGSN